MRYIWVRGRCDCTSARHIRDENRSDTTSGYRSSGKRDANKDMGKHGLHEGRFNSDEPQISGHQPQSNLRRRKNTNNVLHMVGRDLWLSFLVVENLSDSDQFIVGRDFVRNFDVMIDLNNGLIMIRNPDRKYVKRPIDRIITDENKVPFFLDRKKIQPGQVIVAIFRMRNLKSLKDSKQVRLVPNPNSLGDFRPELFSNTKRTVCSVLLNTMDTTVSIQRGKELGDALPMKADYEDTQNLYRKRYIVKDCPNHAESF